MERGRRPDAPQWISPTILYDTGPVILAEYKGELSLWAGWAYPEGAVDAVLSPEQAAALRNALSRWLRDSGHEGSRE